MPNHSNHHSQVDRVVAAFLDQTRFDVNTDEGMRSVSLDDKTVSGSETPKHNTSSQTGDDLVYLSIGSGVTVGKESAARNRRRENARRRQRSNRRNETPTDGADESTADSSGEEEFDIGLTANHVVKTSSGNIRSNGNCLVCLCPDCSAPMSVRLWLELADCWRCHTSIQLSAEQLRSAREVSAPVSANSATPLSQIPELIPVSEPQTVEPAEPTYAPAPSPIPVPVAAPDYSELERLTEGSLFASLVRRGFQMTPAYVVSFLLHLVVLLVLALIVMGGSDEEDPSITLSTTISTDDELGGDIRIENPLAQLQDDLPIANDLPEDDREIRDVIKRAEQDARELQVDPQPMAQQPDIDVLRRNLTTTPGQRMSFAARDPRVRSEIVRQEGGTMMTEAAVARGLRWLASVQNKDGSWSLGNYSSHDNPRSRGDALGTSLALLPFLGAGQTHEIGIYKETVARGLGWLINNQKDDGDLRAGFRDNAGMYAHGQASIVLCEALAMTGDEQFREPAQIAIRFIEQAQHRQGGWRYHPGDAGDTSVLGWQVMALQSARAPNVGLEVNDATMSLADYFLDSVTVSRNRQKQAGQSRTYSSGSLYCYMKGRKATPAITAEALLCRMYLGWTRDDPRLEEGIDWLMTNHLPSEDEMNVYYWYYGSQLMHHYGGEDWKVWNQQVKNLLLSTQETRGRNPGSWSPGDFEWGDQGGRIYTTALSVCTLEVYYRHLPLFRQLEPDMNR